MRGWRERGKVSREGEREGGKKREKGWEGREGVKGKEGREGEGEGREGGRECR